MKEHARIELLFDITMPKGEDGSIDLHNNNDNVHMVGSLMTVTGFVQCILTYVFSVKQSER